MVFENTDPYDHLWAYGSNAGFADANDTNVCSDATEDSCADANGICARARTPATLARHCR